MQRSRGCRGIYLVLLPSIRGLCLCILPGKLERATQTLTASAPRGTGRVACVQKLAAGIRSANLQGALSTEAMDTRSSTLFSLSSVQPRSLLLSLSSQTKVSSLTSLTLGLLLILCFLIRASPLHVPYLAVSFPSLPLAILFQGWKAGGPPLPWYPV